MERDKIPDHWKRVRIDGSDLQIPSSKQPTESCEIANQSRAVYAIEDPDGIQIIQKKFRPQPNDQAKQRDELIAKCWIDIVDGTGYNRDILYSTIRLESGMVNEHISQCTALVDGIRKNSQSDEFVDNLSRAVGHRQMADMVLEEYSEDTIKKYLHDAIFDKYKEDWVRPQLNEGIEEVYELSDSDWEPELPNDNQTKSAVVRRYIDISKFSSLLESGLWFNRIDNFSDNFEGVVSGYEHRNRSDTDHYLNSEDDPPLVTQKSWGETKDKLVRKQSYASCWRFGGEESSVFWDAYIGNGNGIAVETSLDKLVSALENSNREVLIGKVEYKEYKGGTEGFADDHVAQVFHKRFAFEDERELRLLTRKPINDIDIKLVGGYDNNTIRTKIDADPGLKIEVDTDKLIDRVLLSPDIDDRTIGLVLKLLDHHNIDAEVMRSRLDLDPKDTSPVRATGENKGIPTDPDMEGRRRIDQSKWL